MISLGVIFSWTSKSSHPNEISRELGSWISFAAYYPAISDEIRDALAHIHL